MGSTTDSRGVWEKKECSWGKRTKGVKGGRSLTHNLYAVISRQEEIVLQERTDLQEVRGSSLAKGEEREGRKRPSALKGGQVR